MTEAARPLPEVSHVSTGDYVPVSRVQRVERTGNAEAEGDKVMVELPGERTMAELTYVKNLGDFGWWGLAELLRYPSSRQHMIQKGEIFACRYRDDADPMRKGWIHVKDSQLDTAHRDHQLAIEKTAREKAEAEAEAERIKTAEAEAAKPKKRGKAA